MLFSTTRAVLGSALLLSLSASATPTELSARETEEFKSIWFTMKFWALKDTSTVTSSHWHWSDKWLSKDKNQFLKKEGVPETRDFPDPVDGSPEQTQKYTIVGDMHFERVPPDNSWRDVYIVLDPGGPTQNNTKVSLYPVSAYWCVCVTRRDH